MTKEKQLIKAIADVVSGLRNEIEDLQSENERLKAELLGNPEQLKAEMENVLNEVKDEIVEKFDSDPMVRRISNMVINEIKKRIITP